MFDSFELEKKLESFFCCSEGRKLELESELVDTWWLNGNVGEMQLIDCGQRPNYSKYHFVVKRQRKRMHDVCVQERLNWNDSFISGPDCDQVKEWISIGGCSWPCAPLAAA